MVCLTTLDESSPGLALGTAQGVVKRVVPDYPSNKEELEVITLKDGDRIVGAIELRTGEEDLVFITDDAQLLRYQASQVRPQGRAAGGMAGIKLTDGAKVISFTAVDPAVDAVVFTVAGSRGTLDDSVQTTAKLTPFDQYPRKGRATGDVDDLAEAAVHDPRMLTAKHHAHEFLRQGRSPHDDDDAAD